MFFFEFLYPLQLEDNINKCNLIWTGLIVSLESDSSFLTPLPTKTHLVLFWKWLVSKLDLFPHWLFSLFYPNEQATVIFYWRHPLGMYRFIIRSCVLHKSTKKLKFLLQICFLSYIFCIYIFLYITLYLNSFLFSYVTNLDSSVCCVSLFCLLLNT